MEQRVLLGEGEPTYDSADSSLISLESGDLPFGVPPSTSNVRLHDALRHDEERTTAESRAGAKTPVFDVDDVDAADTSQVVSRTPGNEPGLAWDAYDSRLATPVQGDKAMAQSGVRTPDLLERTSKYPARPVCRTPPIPAWPDKNPENGKVEGRPASRERPGSPVSVVIANTTAIEQDDIRSSSPIPGLSSGRPKLGSFAHNFLHRKGGRVMPSPLTMVNPTAAYSEIVRQEPNIRKVQVDPVEKEADDYSYARTPVVPPRTPESKIIIPTDMVTHRYATATPAPAKPPRPDVTLPRETLASTTEWTDSDLYDSVLSSELDGSPSGPYAKVKVNRITHVNVQPATSVTQNAGDSASPSYEHVSQSAIRDDNDDYLTANMASTEALDHFDSQWYAQGTHLSPLHYAASFGKQRYLLLLLKQLQHSNLSDKSIARLERLRQRGQSQGLTMVAVTDIDCLDSHGRTALMHAVHSQHAECCQLLIQEGADVNHSAPDGSRLLHLACYDGSREMVKLLLEHGASPHLKDKSGRTPLHWASVPFGRSCVHLLLKKVPDLDVNAADESGMTALMWAAYHNSVEVIEELLNHGADSLLEDVDGMQAIHWAVHPNHCESLETLMAVSSCRSRDVRGRTIAHMAAEHGAATCLKLIMGSWPECIHQCDDEGRTPLHWAAVCNKPTIVRLLLMSGANADAPDRQNNTPHYYANVRDFRDCASLLSTPISSRPKSSAANTDATTNEDMSSQQWCTKGSWLGKFTLDGRGPMHRRFFWLDPARGKICWSKESKEKDPKSVKVIDLIGTASAAIQARADYKFNIRQHNHFYFTVLTPERSLELVAFNATDHQCWVQGLRHLLLHKMM